MSEYPTVSVVIPTIGRDSLGRAVDSALRQTIPVLEVIVVADTDGELTIPDDDRISVVRTGPFSGSANARQTGIDSAGGEVIALLDDDDLWHPFKLQRQLDEVADIGTDEWVVTCKCAVRELGKRERIWPRHTIGEREPVAEYLFRLRGPTLGGSMLQSSTFCFPRTLASAVPVNCAPDSIHDEPGWLMALQAERPALVIRQVRECFSVYNISADSVSRSTADESAEYIAWGREHLSDASARTRGDYYLTSAVTAAESAHSLGGIWRASVIGFTEGRPGLFAIAYAAAKFGRAAVRRVTSRRATVRRVTVRRGLEAGRAA